MTRITLDLDALLASGELTQAEAERLSALAVKGQGLPVLIQVLSILGALGIAAGVVALNPEPVTGIVLAVMALGFATVVQQRKIVSLSVLETGMAIAGTLGLSASVGMQLGDLLPPIATNGLMTLIVLAGALWFRSSFLIAFVPLGLAAMLGSGTAYWHAAYAIFIREGTITVIVFAALALGLFWLARRLAGVRAHQAIIAARVSWLVMNFGFWVGSLWGDYVGEHFFAGDGWDRDWEKFRIWRETALFIPDWVFVVAWAAVSIATIFVLKSNRFAVNAAIVFLAINAYTQFFERFGESALALLVGGATLLAFAFGLFNFDRWATARRSADAAGRPD